MVTAVVDHDGEADGDVSLRCDYISLSLVDCNPIPIHIFHSTSTSNFGRVVKDVLSQHHQTRGSNMSLFCTILPADRKGHVFLKIETMHWSSWNWKNLHCPCSRLLIHFAVSKTYSLAGLETVFFPKPFFARIGASWRWVTMKKWYSAFYFISMIPFWNCKTKLILSSSSHVSFMMYYICYTFIYISFPFE